MDADFDPEMAAFRKSFAMRPQAPAFEGTVCPVVCYRPITAVIADNHSRGERRDNCDPEVSQL